MQYFPDNTVAHFKTKLTECICENGNYEVALTELIYPMNYFNFVTKEVLKISYIEDGFVVSGCEIESGYYENERELAEYITDCLAEFIDSETEVSAVLSYDETTKKMKFERGGEPYTLEAGKIVIHEGKEAWIGSRLILQDDFDLYPSLGFHEGFIERFASGTFDMIAGQRLMYVYSDIVTPYPVGDVKAPLLRVFTPNGKRDEMISLTFNNPYYLPVVRRGFDTIEININNEFGQPVPFTGGKSVALLHFRKRDESLLPNAAFG